jgi:hypothetical protein
MTENNAYTGRLAPIKRWLDGVTENHLLAGVGIVALTSVRAGATAYSNASGIQVPVSGASGMLQSISTISAVIMTFLGWVLSSVIYHIGATILGGRGSLKRMFVLSGYASIPLLTQQLLRFVYYVVLGQQVSASASTGLLATLVDHFTVFNIIGLVLVGVAVMLNYSLSGRRAAIVAILPMMISFVFVLAIRQLFGGVTGRALAGDPFAN